MWTYGAISLTVTLAVISAGVLGFVAGWLARGAVSRERRDEREMFEAPDYAPPGR